jgi:hypothetical protein
VSGTTISKERKMSNKEKMGQVIARTHLQHDPAPKIKITKKYVVGYWDGYRNVVFATGDTERGGELSYADALDKHPTRKVMLVEQEYNELGYRISERVLLRSR